MSMIHHHTEYQTPSSSGSVTITVKLKARDNFQMGITLCLVLQENWINKSFRPSQILNLVLNKSISLPPHKFAHLSYYYHQLEEITKY